MFGDMTPEEQTRMAKAYMAQNRTPMTNANLSQVMQSMATNPGMQAFIGNQLNANDATMRDDGRGNINAVIEQTMLDEPMTAAPAPVSNRRPPSRPVNAEAALYKEGGDPVSLAGGTTEPMGPPASMMTRPASGGKTDTAGLSLPQIIMMTLLGAGGAVAAGGLKKNKMPVGDTPDDTSKYKFDPKSGKYVDEFGNYDPTDPRNRSAEQDMYAKKMPPQGDIVDTDKQSFNPPVSTKSAAVANREGTQVDNFRDKPNSGAYDKAYFDQVFNEIPDAEYKVVTPKAIPETKKLTGPKEVDDRDNVKKADGEVIEGKADKTTTAKEKLKKPKVRVR